jgi:hypothetical protein
MKTGKYFFAGKWLRIPRILDNKAFIIEADDNFATNVIVPYGVTDEVA